MAADPRYAEALDCDDQPEWETVEQERDYWKKLAHDYAAKITMMKCVLAGEFTFTQETDGSIVAVMVSSPPLKVEDEEDV